MNRGSMKQLIIKSLVTAFTTLLSLYVHAYDAYIGGIYYNLNTSNKTATVTYKNTAYNSYSGSVTIPSTISYQSTTYTVKSIGEQAFQNCSNLTSVTIPNSVTYIGSWAFLQATGVKDLIIPNSVTTIDSYAFKDCSALQSITLSNSITTIASSTFYGCKALTSVNIPEGVTYIGYGAFWDCSSLTTVNIPSIVTSIGACAFQNCSNLASITFPDNITIIGGNAFLGTAWYNNQPTGLIYINNVAYKYKGTMPQSTNITLNQGCISISEDAFSNCSGLTSISIPASVKSIGYQAFSGCSRLSSVVIPNSVTTIGDYAFEYCTRLTSITSEITTPFTISYYTFVNIPANCVLTVPYGAKDAYIAAGWTEDVFKGGIVEAVPNITFADANVEAICVANWDTNGDGGLSEEEAAAVTDLGTVFKNNTQITSFDELQYFTGLTSIGTGTFYCCNALSSVIIPNNVTSIGQYAFCDCSSLTSVTFSNNVTSIGDRAFQGCSGLTTISIPNSVTSIGYAAFSGCSSLTTVSIPNNVTSIVTETFDGCSGLTSVSIPNGVTSIGNSAFRDCSGLTSVTIPNSVTSIIGSYAFKNCTNLTSVISEIEEPSDFNIYAFQNISPTCTLTVPYGTRDAYIAAGWSESVFKGGIVELDNRNEQSMELASLPAKTYGDAAYTLPATTTQGLTLTWTSGNTNVATISGNTLTVKGAGTATITASQAGNEEYKPFSKEFTLTVAKAPLTITAKSYTIMEGEALPAFEATYSGFKNNETQTVLTTQPTLSCSIISSSTPGSYDITPSGASSANYTITYVKGTLTVTAKASQSMTLTSLPAKTYGDAAYTLPATTTEGLTLTWTSGNTNVATISGNTLTVKGSGSATITATQAGNNNYTPFSREFALTVAKAPLTITAKSYTIMEGEALPTFEATYSGFKNNETPMVLTTQPTLSCSTTSSSTPGTYDITPSGASSANYTITYVKGTLTVTAKAAQSMTLTSLPEKTYGDVAYTLPATTTEGLTLTWTSGNTSVATISGNTLSIVGAGTATITASQAGNDNYKPFSREFTLTVAQAPLTITANDATKNVGEENPAFTASYEGFVGEDDATVLTAQPTFTCEATTESPVGTYDINVSGAEAANYEMTYVKGTLTVVEAVNNTLSLTDVQVLCGRQIILPVSMTNTEDITAIQFDLTLPAGVSIAKNSKGKYILATTGRCADHTLSASKPGEANVYKVLLYSPDVESITGNEGAVINVTLEAAENMEAGDYEVRISDINLTTTAEKKISPTDATCVLTVHNSIPGDANGDNVIDVTDIVGIANSILDHASESFDAVAADVNGDGSVDVTDIVVVANIILHDGGVNAAKVREAMQMMDPQ